MPDDSNKNQNKKNKNDAKEQRRPRSPRRHSRNQGSQGLEKKEKPDVKSEKANEKPSSQEPGPEFYKNLKRETEEILKISEEAHAKYAKKEIHSNWKKYELPTVSYEDIEEQENIGSDYEQLIQTPMGSGGHFQFKHEKNWDAVITPSEYDKFFEIDLQNLPIALMSIPFYERNNIHTKVFTPGDISNMKNRANKFKQKYEESIQTKKNNLQINLPSVNKNADSGKVDTTIENILEECKTEEIKEPIDVESQDLKPANKSINLEFNELKKFPKTVSSNQQMSMQVKNERDSAISEVNVQVNIDSSEGIVDQPLPLLKEINSLHGLHITRDEKKLDVISQKQNLSAPEHLQNTKNEVSTKVTEEKTQEVPKSTPIIQSSEDLEKWLDDFLDG